MLKGFIFLASFLLTLFIVGALGYVYLESQLPDVSALKAIKLEVPLQVYTKDNKLIGEFGPIRREYVDYEHIPPLLIKALLATEDRRFFEHKGVDIYGLFRALGNLVLTRSKSQGGSTITMQVARNFYLTRQKTFTRKLQEILLALKIDRTLGKEKILELYLNKIYFGEQAYGISAAAQAYYGKTLDALTLPEMAMLAGLPRAPSAINPIANPAASKARRDHVLSRLLALNDITQAAYDQAVNTPVHAAYHGRRVEVWAPYVGEMVRNMTAETLGETAFTQSYKVYTTVDSTLQWAGNEAVRKGLLAYDRRHPYRGVLAHLPHIEKYTVAQLQKYLKLIPYANGLQPAVVLSIEPAKNSGRILIKKGEPLMLSAHHFSWPRLNTLLKAGDMIWVDHTEKGEWELAQIPEAQAALVALDPHTGAINALVGGFDFRLSNFNRVTQAYRQPGSGFKPFIYAAALDKGYTLASVFDDAPLAFKDPHRENGEWRPQNDTRDFNGPTRLRLALAHSVNLVSIRILQAIGLEYALDYVTRFGFNPQKLPHDLTLALGTGSVTPLEMVQGYAVLANGGYRISPYIIDHITDAQGRVIFQYQSKSLQQVLSPETDFLITDALKTVITQGTATQALSLKRSDIAGKTGTSNDDMNNEMDAWFNGFNGDRVCTVWIGFDRSRPLKEYGGHTALPIWIDFMQAALKNQPETLAHQPPDIVAVKIDAETGLLARPDQKESIFEYFTEETIPKETAPEKTVPADSAFLGEAGEPVF